MGRKQRVLSFAWVTWLLSGAGDQVLGMYERLPERLRGWIGGYIIAPVVGAMTLVVFLIWGMVRDLDPIYVAALIIVTVTGVMVSAVILILAITGIKRRAFEVTAISTSGVQIGTAEDVLKPERVYARIAVTSKRDVRECVALLTAISSYERNFTPPMQALQWNARYLSWTPDEDRLRRATILTGITMTADLAVVHRDEPEYFVIASADEGTRHKFPVGFYKIDLTVLSESGGGARRDVSLALLNEPMPVPGGQLPRFVLQPWSDRFVETMQKEDAERRSRKERESRAEAQSAPSASDDTALSPTPSPESTPGTASPQPRQAP